MTDQEMNIAIAEACGWRREWVSKDRHIQQWVCRRPDGIVDYCDPDPDATWETHRLPDYINDLNAMHEAEKVLTDEQYVQFCNNLLAITSPEYVVDDAWASRAYMSATAAQRAEAFLRTLGKWKE